MYPNASLKLLARWIEAPQAWHLNEGDNEGMRNVLHNGTDLDVQPGHLCMVFSELSR